MKTSSGLLNIIVLDTYTENRSKVHRYVIDHRKFQPVIGNSFAEK